MEGIYFYEFRVATFNDCESASVEWKKLIFEARKDLRKKRFGLMQKIIEAREDLRKKRFNLKKQIMETRRIIRRIQV